MRNVIALAGVLFWIAVMVAVTPHVLPDTPEATACSPDPIQLIQQPTDLGRVLDAEFDCKETP